MTTLLVRDLELIATMDDAETVARGGIYVEDNRLVAVGSEVPTTADEVIDGRGMIAMPGMVNTHHHLYQTLTRNVPIVQDAGLFDWLVNLYEIWRELTPEAVYVSTQVGLGELLLTGCTLSTDMFYVFPKSAPADLFDNQVRAGRELGARFMPCRGSMSRGRSEGGLPPDDVVQDEDTILRDCERVIEAYHDGDDPLAMTRIAIAPCSPFSVTPDLMRASRDLARRYGVWCHTHLAETVDEESYCLQIYGKRPFEFMEEVGWNADDCWWAHSIYISPEEVTRQKAGVAHCPTSNFRLGSGTAPIPEMIRAGVRVGLGVDGSASNDSSDMLGEARHAMLAHRVRLGARGMTARQALRLATRGGADVLGWDRLGVLAPGYGADFFLKDLRGIGYAGALHDPLAALVFCGFDHRVDYTVVNGRVVVREGRLVNVDEAALVRRHNEIASDMVDRAARRTGIEFLKPPEESRKRMDASEVLAEATGEARA